MKTICYLSYGYPTIEHSLNMARVYCAAGCDMIEVSIPAKDPFLDPEYVAARMGDALAACSDYDVYLHKLEAFLCENPNIPVVLLMYEQTILEIGVEKLLEFCSRCGIGDLIYGGLRDNSVKQNLINAGMRISCPVTHQMLDEDVQSVLASNGFVYMEARPQKPPKSGFETLEQCITHLRELGVTRPIYCGVGVRSPEDVRHVRISGGDGVFIGSTLIRLYNDEAALAQIIRNFKAETVE